MGGLEKLFALKQNAFRRDLVSCVGYMPFHEDVNKHPRVMKMI